MSLIAWYPLNGDTKDYSGNGNDIDSGTPSWVDGKIGLAAGGSRLYTSNRPSLNISNNLTITFWIKRVADITAYSEAPIEKYAGTATANFRCHVFGSNQTLVYYANRDGIWGTISSIHYLPLNKWEHVTLTYQNGGQLYVNGVEVGGKTGSGDLALNTASLAMMSGSFIMNDIRIYDHVLSEKEIKEIAKAKILHYTFNDFQEPTENLFQDALLEDKGLWTSIAGQITYLGDGTVRLKRSTSGTGNWQMRQVNNINWDIGDNISMSFEAKRIAGGDEGTSNFDFSFGIWGALPSWNIGHVATSSNIKRTSLGGGWYRIEGTLPPTTNSGSTPSCFIHTMANNLEIEYLIRKPQFEKKPYSTPFTPNTRPGTVIDVSGYNNHAELDLAATPRWIEDSKVGSGAYEFDGSAARIQTGNNFNFSKEDSFSFSCWVNINDHSHKASAAAGIIGKGHWYPNTWVLFLLNTNAAAFEIAGDTSIPERSTITTPSLTLHTWTHLAGTYDNGAMKLYMDGNLIGSTTYTGVQGFTGSREVRLGMRHTDGSRILEGKIDNPRIYATALTASDIKELYQSRASLDDKGNLQSILFHETKTKPLILNYTTWEDGQTGSIGNFNQNGSTSENNRVLSNDPWGKTVPVWRTTPDSSSGPDGGWNSYYYPIDRTKTYRWSVWVRRYTAGTGGIFYFGLNPAPIRNDNGSTQSNPYFTHPAISSLIQNQWYLVVGHCFYENYSGGRHPDSGWYENGTKISDRSYGNVGSQDVKWAPATTSSMHRAYHYYTTNIDSGIDFAYPRVDILDGNEPSIQDLLDGFDSRNFEYYKMTNGTNPLNLTLSEKELVSSEFSEIGPSKGLIAWYPLNSDTEDYTENRNNGINNGATPTSGAPTGGGYDFNGSSWIDLGDSFYMADNHPFAVTGWMNHRSFSVRDMMLCRNNAIRNTGPYTWLLGTISGSSMSAYDGVAWQNISYNFALDTWYHLVFSFDGTVMHYYINGEKIGESTYSFTDSVTGRNTQIGGYNVGSDLDGRKSDIRIYNRALSAEEISILYKVTDKRSKQKMLQSSDGTVYVKGQFKENY